MATDYISRDAAIKIVKTPNYNIHDMLFALKTIPAYISPDEVRGVGKWVEKEVYNIENTTIEQMQSASCSVCGKIHTTPFSYYFSKFNYCPNCGAKMEVSEDG